MDAYDERVISELRRLSRYFISGQISFDAFYGTFCKSAHLLFDADQTSMPERLSREVEFYLRWEGFGPREGHVPENSQWQYGSLEKFGWIDKKEFAKRFAEEYEILVPT